MRKQELDFKEVNGCFIVTSHRLNSDGYCYLFRNGRAHRAHRLIYTECFGEIPDGLSVRHKCDNRCCINPEHLELGTHQENMMDKVFRGRNAIGEKNGRSTITEQQAKEIKILLQNGVPARRIPKLLGVGYRAVRGIKESNTWKHVVI